MLPRITPVILGLTLVLSACQGAPKTTDTGPIKLGLIAPLTGDIAAIGKDMLNGAQFAVDTINAAGGVNGRTVSLIAEDGKCAGNEAANAAQKLVNVDHVVAIVGGLCSGETLAAAPIVEAGQVPLISPGSSSPDVTKAGNYVYRNYPSDALKTTAMANYFAKKNWKKVAIISENTDFNQSFRKDFTAKLTDGSVVFDEVVEPGTKDYRTVLGRLQGKEFDAFFPNGQSDSTIAIMIQQFRQLGFTQPMIAHDAADSLTIDTVAPEASQGFLLISVPTAGQGTDFETSFTTKYGTPKSSIAWAAQSYDAANVFMSAIKAKGTAGPDIKSALDTMPSYTGVVGAFHFDANGDVVGIPYALKEHRDGKISKLEEITVN